MGVAGYEEGHDGHDDSDGSDEDWDAFDKKP